MNIRECISNKNRWYRNCRVQRKRQAKICSECPIKETIEQIENEFKEGKQ